MEDLSRTADQQQHHDDGLSCDVLRHPAMAVFVHHCYEFRRGLRNLVLHTAPAEFREPMRKHLERLGAAYVFQDINRHRINVFFGLEPHVSVIRSFGTRTLSDYSPEQDFLLGTMLGYDGAQQCRRYLQRKQAAQSSQHQACACGGRHCACAAHARDGSD